MSHKVRAAVFGASLMCCLVVLLAEHWLGPEAHTRALSLIISLTGLAIFLLHGGARITVTGIFGIAYAIFCGYGGWVVLNTDGPSRGLTTALLATAVGLAGSTLLMRPLAFPKDQEGIRGGGGPFILLGTAMLFALVLMRNSLPALFADGASFMSTTLVGVGIIYGRSRRAAILAPVLLLPYVVAYSELFHGSSGRLRLVALAGCLAIVYSARFARNWHKPVMLGLIPPILGYLAWDRLQVQEQMGGAGASVGNTGLESMVTPPRAFGLLVEAQNNGRLELKWGESFLSPLTVFLPDAWRPEWAPGVFNYELAAITEPSRYGTGYSTAGSYFGEWWWNFGPFGIFLAALLTGPTLMLLDSLASRALSEVSRSARAVVAACAVLAFAGAVADLSWAGPHTWLVRGLTRLPVLMLVLLFVAVRRVGPVVSRRARQSSPRPRTLGEDA